MKHEEYEELAALYALRALDMPERESFEAHLATGCAACQSSLRKGAQQHGQSCESYRAKRK